MEKQNIPKPVLKESDLEVCVYCGEKTDVKKNTHIDERKYYVEGCGQLHEKCYSVVYKNSI